MNLVSRFSFGKSLLKSLIAFSLLVSASAEAKTQKTFRSSKIGVVTYCHDGDTCTVDVGGEIMKVRFSGIDSPEINQDGGVEAKHFTESLVKGKTVTLKCEGKSYKRDTCIVFLNDQDLNRVIVRSGWALDSPRYSKGAYKPDELEAESRKVGIWKRLYLKSPYCFRHKKDKKCERAPLFMP